MAGNLGRGGVAVLAMLTVAAGGAAVGVANAAGSSEETCSIFLDCGGEEQLGYGSRGDVGITYLGPAYAVAGQDVTFTADLGALPFYEGASPETVISSVTHRAPEGFTFVGADVTSYEETPGVYPVKFLDSSAAVDSETGDVTVTAPDGGWAVPPRVAGTTNWVHRVEVKLHYHVTKPIAEEFARSYITFTGPEVPASDDWVAQGATYPGTGDPALFGSLGS